MELDKDTLKIAVFIAILVMTVGRLLLQKLRGKKRLEEETGPSTEAPVEEPMLPYEDLAEQVLGPYMKRRRKEYAARRTTPLPTESSAEESTPPEPSLPLGRPPRPEPRSVERREAGKQELKPSVPSPSQAVPAASAAPESSLESRLFGNRALSSGAKVFLASEIMRRPRFLRGGTRR